MNDDESLNHTKWECKYHIVLIPKCRKKCLFGKIRSELGPIFRARGYFVSTVGRDKATIRKYIKNQEKEDERLVDVAI